jgi:hypothetical protein
MEKAVADWLRGQNAAGLVVGHDGQADVILRELRHQSDIKYVRLRRDGGQVESRGKGKSWVYVGVRLKVADTAGTSK